MMNDLNPRFSKHMTMEFIFEAMQELRVLVCDYDATSNHDFLVSAGNLPQVFRIEMFGITPLTGSLLHERCSRDGLSGWFSNPDADGSQKS